MSQRHDVVHATTAHRGTDVRIHWKECTALRAAGFDVAIVAPGDGDSVYRGIPILSLPQHSRTARMLRGPVDLWRKLRSVRPSVLHIHDPELIPLAVIWRRVHDCKVVYDAHEDLEEQVYAKSYLPKWSKPIVAFLVRRLFRLADTHLDAIVAATPVIAKRFCSPSLTLVQNFPWARDFPEPMALNDTDATFVYIGVIADLRGADGMLRSIERVRNQSARLLLAGPIRDQSLLERIRKNRSGRVDYRGHLPPGEIPALVMTARAGLVVIHPLKYYVSSQPTKMYEYMGAGIPFIASDFVYWREMLADYDCGIFVDPLDNDAIVAAMETLASDPDSAREMGLRGRKAMLERFNFESQAESLVKLNQALLEASNSKRKNTMQSA